MIELGLARIGRLLNDTPQPWKAIHVAGTNGKGSICAYISTFLWGCGIRSGRFTSPHVMDPWDCITINRRAIPRKLFQSVERQVKQRNQRHLIGATEFEILTATAFEIFNKAKVEVGVVEVGLGGRLDATNILQHKAVTVISKIGLDHQAFLGNTIEEIAKHKAGIMRPNVPCVLDRSNDLAVQKVVTDHAKEIGTKVILNSGLGNILKQPGGNAFAAPHQWDNLTCAYTAARIVNRGIALPKTFFPLLRSGSLPGRLQSIHIKSAGRRSPVLLDGAHNVQSAEALCSYVDKRLRRRQYDDKVTWLIGISKGKGLEGILKPLIQDGDQVVAVEFGPVNGMPWVAPARSTDIMAAAKSVGGPSCSYHDGGASAAKATRLAVRLAGHGPLVIAGSLYLVSDILKRRRYEMRLDRLYMHAEDPRLRLRRTRLNQRQARKIAERRAWRQRRRERYPDDQTILLTDQPQLPPASTSDLLH